MVFFRHFVVKSKVLQEKIGLVLFYSLRIHSQVRPILVSVLVWTRFKPGPFNE